MWENVPGVLSTHDNAFGCFLAGLAGESEPVNAPNGRWPTAGIIVGTRRSVAWRVLDAQYFGLAQRRKRVFVVASARTDIDIGQILIEFDGVQRTTKPRRETGQSDTRTTAVGVDADSGASTVARAAVSIQGNIIDRNHGGAQGAGISTEDISYTLTTADRHAVAFRSPVVIRRLTPRECERLQGFPDDYTLIPYKGKDASDAVRYHALGNSWAVSVVRWIGRRIVNITK
jgi:DNA (cytosine-5)-methyltransferase 1